MPTSKLSAGNSAILSSRSPDQRGGRSRGLRKGAEARGFCYRHVATQPPKLATRRKRFSSIPSRVESIRRRSSIGQSQCGSSNPAAAFDPAILPWLAALRSFVGLSSNADEPIRPSRSWRLRGEFLPVESSVRDPRVDERRQLAGAIEKPSHREGAKGAKRRKSPREPIGQNWIYKNSIYIAATAHPLPPLYTHVSSVGPTRLAEAGESVTEAQIRAQIPMCVTKAHADAAFFGGSSTDQPADTSESSRTKTCKWLSITENRRRRSRKSPRVPAVAGRSITCGRWYPRQARKPGERNGWCPPSADLRRYQRVTAGSTRCAVQSSWRVKSAEIRRLSCKMPCTFYRRLPS